MKGTKRLIEVLNRLDSLEEQIEEFYQDVKTSLEGGGKILLFGNGGSAADSQHIAAEFIVRFKDDRKSIPAIALTTDASIITATANDYCYEDIFKRQLEGLAYSKDYIIALSTSGTSKNVIKALEYCEEIGIKHVLIAGQKCPKRFNHLTIPSKETARIQEATMNILHNLCEYIDEK